MSLIPCSECKKEISSNALMCIHCGNPMAASDNEPGKMTQMWNAVTKARTPINIFALAMMACASVLGFSATDINTAVSLTAFTYAIHAFLAVTAMFFLTILFVKKGLYHPEDLGKVKSEVLKDFGKDQPMIAAVIIVVMLFSYGYYQQDKFEKIIEAAHSQKIQSEPSVAESKKN